MTNAKGYSDKDAVAIFRTLKENQLINMTAHAIAYHARLHRHDVIECLFETAKGRYNEEAFDEAEIDLRHFKVIYNLTEIDQKSLTLNEMFKTNLLFGYHPFWETHEWDEHLLAESVMAYAAALHPPMVDDLVRYVAEAWLPVAHPKIITAVAYALLRTKLIENSNGYCKLNRTADWQYRFENAYAEVMGELQLREMREKGIPV